MQELMTCYEEGHWFLDDDNNLYIVPNDAYGIADLIGPEGELFDKLIDAYRLLNFCQIKFANIEPEHVAACMGIYCVPEWQQRFDREAGYYVA